MSGGVEGILAIPCWISLLALFADLALLLPHLYRALVLVFRRGFCILRLLRSSLAVPVSFMQTGANIESFAAPGSGLCQHCSYLRSHSRQPLMRPIEIPENRAG